MIYILRDERGVAVLCGDLDDLRQVAPELTPEAAPELNWESYEGSV